MPQCLEEIARCRTATPRPNFVVLLGDRYGWRPLPDEVPDDEFAQILTNVASPADRRYLARWYRRDDNGVPASWVLQPRRVDAEPEEDRAREAAGWADSERRLGRVLLRAVRRAGAAAGLNGLTASATHREIAAGALATADPPGHAFAFVRSIRGPPADGSAGRFVDLDARGRRDRAARAALQRLRTEVLDRLGPQHVHRYDASWTGDGISSDHLAAFCRDVLASLLGVISAELDEWGTRDPLEIEVTAHREFAAERRRHFVGRARPRSDIALYLAGSERCPLLVRGAAGSGKSALMAQAVADLVRSQTDAVVVSRFIGATAASTAGTQLVEGICAELGHALGVETPRSDDSQELARAFESVLQRGSPHRPVILFVDGVDQLPPSDPARRLDWLPKNLPPHARVVLSTVASDENLDPVPVRRSMRFLDLLPMTDEEGDTLLDRWLEAARRSLTPEQRRTVLEGFAESALPLYLRVAFERARQWRSYEPAVNLPPDVAGLIRELLAKLADDAEHGPMLVERGLGYLAAARNGLTEEELVDVLSLDPDVMEDFRRRSPDSPPIDRLPASVWSRLLSDVEPYVTQRVADGTTTIGFYHRQLAEVITAEFVSGRSRLTRSRHLARYFAAQSTLLRVHGRPAPNLRKVRELPFLQTRGALWRGLDQTLCDLEFIAAKAAAGLTSDLINDYDAAADALPESRQEQRVRDDHDRRLTQYALELDRYATQCATAHGAHAAPHGGPRPPPSVRPAGGEQGRRTTTRGERIAAFGQFVNSESHRLSRFIGYPTYLVQQAHNAASEGPVATAAEQRLGVAVVTAPALLARPWSRPDREPQPLIVRRFDAWSEVDGGVVAMTPDGRLAVSNSTDGLRVWELATGRMTPAVEAAQGWIGAVAITARGETAVTGSGDHTVRIWDTATGRCLNVLRGHTDRPAAVCVTLDGSRIASGGSGNDRTVRIWDARGARGVRTLFGHEDTVGALAITANGARLVSGSADTTVRIWDVASGSCLKVLRAHRQPISSVAVTPDGASMVSCGEDGKVVLWDLVRGRRLQTLRPPTEEPCSAAITADGTLVVAALSAALTVWDGESGEVLAVLRPAAGSVGPLEHLAISADGSVILTGSYNGLLNLWDITRGHHEFTENELYAGNVSSVAFSADGRAAVIASDDGALFLNSNTRTGRDTAVLHSPGYGHRYESAAADVDGARVIAALGDGSIGVYGRTGRRLHTLRTDGSASFVVVGVDGRLVISGGDDHLLQLWDLETRRPLRELSGHPDTVSTAAIAPDGTLLVSGGADEFGQRVEKLILWNTRTGEVVRILEGHESWVHCVALFPDGRRVVSGGLEPSLRTWDVRTGECLHVLEGHTEEVLGVAVTPDGRLIVSGSRDHTLRLWSAQTGACLAVAALPYVITALALSGREVLVGGQVGNVSQFRLHDPEESVARSTVGYLYDHARRRWEPTPGATCPWCGWRFRPSASVLTATMKVIGDRDRSPCLELPDEAFSNPDLRGACTRCHAPLLFNPFVLDTRASYL